MYPSYPSRCGGVFVLPKLFYKISNTPLKGLLGSKKSLLNNSSLSMKFHNIHQANPWSHTLNSGTGSEKIMPRANHSESLNTLLSNFQSNFGKLSDLCTDKLRHKSSSLWKRYCLDFLISHFIIAPAVIAFWRGTWDYSWIYLDERLFENVKTFDVFITTYRLHV